jgi:Recombination endonuclease VII
VNHLRRFYDMSPEEYQSLLYKQKGCCAICGSLMDGPRVDHDHQSGKVRGLLCHQCNVVLGLMRENPDRLRNAAEYLENHVVAAKSLR